MTKATFAFSHTSSLIGGLVCLLPSALCLARRYQKVIFATANLIKENIVQFTR